MTQQQEDKIKELAEKYNINLVGNPPYSVNTRRIIDKQKISPESIHLKALEKLDIKKQTDLTKQEVIDAFAENLEIAELIQLLYDSIQEKSKLNISTTIKGIKREVCLNSFSAIKIHFWYLANTVLEEIQDRVYWYELNIPSKKD